MKDKCIKAYLNNKKLDKKQFSIKGLLFGPFLLLYKRMFIPSILSFTIVCISSYYNVELAVLIELIIHLLIGFKFNSMYLHHVNKKVDEIILSNSDKDEKEIIEFCSKKGKPFTPIIVFIVIIGILILILIPFLLKKDKQTPIGKQTLNNLNYQIPNNYHYGKYQSDSYKHYYHIDKNNNCEITITKSNKPLKKIIETSTIEKLSINNNTWYHQISNNKDIYLIEDNKIVYKIIYSIKKDNTCTKEKEEFLSSLSLK